MRFKNIFY